MNKPLRVAIQGFSKFERSTFEAFFKLSLRRTPAYELCTELWNSDLIIADADSAQAMASVASADKIAATLAIGNQAPAGVAKLLPRPINLMNVVKVLDQMNALAGAGPSSSQTAAAARTSDEHQPRWAATQTGYLGIGGQTASNPAPALSESPARIAAPPQTATARPAVPPKPSAPAQSAAPTSAAASSGFTGTGALDHILVVDDSDIALRFMAGRLERFGFTIHLARSGEEALVRTEQQHFAFVFMDVAMPGLDGFQTCKAIKRRSYAPGRKPPAIVMLTSRGTPIDKLRGTMAGCDAYLTKPLDENELLKLIGEREFTQHEFAETAAAQRDH